MRHPFPIIWRYIRSLIARLPWPSIMRRHPVWSGIILILTALIGLAAFALTRPKTPEYVTDTVKRGDVIRTVEAVGTVISERDLALQFPVTGIVAEVYVREGQVVKSGEKLAALRAGTLAADIASAGAAVQSAQADLNALLEGTRPEDIAIAEAELQSKRASLEVAKTALITAERKLESSKNKLQSLESEAKISLAGTVSAAGSTASEYLADARTGIKTINDVFDSIVVQDVVQKDNPAGYGQLKSRQNRSAQELESALSVVATAVDYEEAIADLVIARAAVAGVAEALRQANDFLLGLAITSNFTVSVRDTNSDTLATERGTIQAALSAVDAAINNLRDSTASFTTQISAEKSALASAQGEADRAKADIATYEASVNISEAQLQLKRAGTRPQDIAAARARVAENAARLQRARAAFGDTVLTAPVDGTITKVNVKKGEALPTGAAITMLGTSPYRIELYVAEVDIPLIVVSQSGSIELDAFPGVFDSLRVSEIDEAATDRDGVSKYRVKLDFAFPREELRIGMTGDTEIITGMRLDVLSVPRRSVIENDDAETVVRVLLNGEATEMPITMGMEGSEGEVEVEGVEEGDVVIVLEKN
ncbi:MAG: RND family efflux transporter MFP subunit [Candidatus Peregrinibacteria bacterium Greene0416_62]|nr:MAG: RND family efflux transporter MFP subunit [Candidatus Peregrinibacteria bacterium Greene0416_62]TSD00153.1 MAG: RND family efflux transporter MFP subunit [Candidatus Peregrinibacteria bacterium Greene1014_49]